MLTVLEGLEGKPEEDDWVKQAVQTMSPEDLHQSGGGVEEKREREEKHEKDGGHPNPAGDPWPQAFVRSQR